MVHPLGAVPAESSLAFPKPAQIGTIASQQPQVLARLGEKQRSHRLAELAWKPEAKPAWLDETVYATQVHPNLANLLDLKNCDDLRCVVAIRFRYPRRP